MLPIKVTLYLLPFSAKFRRVICVFIHVPLDLYSYVSTVIPISKFLSYSPLKMDFYGPLTRENTSVFSRKGPSGRGVKKILKVSLPSPRTEPRVWEKSAESQSLGGVYCRKLPFELLVSSYRCNTCFSVIFSKIVDFSDFMLISSVKLLYFFRKILNF